MSDGLERLVLTDVGLGNAGGVSSSIRRSAGLMETVWGMREGLLAKPKGYQKYT